MKLYKSLSSSLFYLAGGQPFEFATCLRGGEQWESCFRNHELAEKPHLFKPIGNNYKQK